MKAIVFLMFLVGCSCGETVRSKPHNIVSVASGYDTARAVAASIPVAGSVAKGHEIAVTSAASIPVAPPVVKPVDTIKQDISQDISSVGPEHVLATVAQRFVEAKGQEICIAAILALSPDWNLASCAQMSDDAGDTRKTDCIRRREPLMEFAKSICETTIEESLRLDLDPLLPIAIMERESSIGRVRYNRETRTYSVDTNICQLFLATHRVTSREPGRREGTEILTWTYGDDLRTNRQQVQVLEENEDGLLINTCAAGEEGLMQTIPREWRRGTVIEATGEVLDGTTGERRERVREDPVLQVRLGCQALAEHRALCPTERHGFWPEWVASYNLGSCSPTFDKWRENTDKVMKHYLQACDNGFVNDETGMPTLIRNVWPECERVRDALDASYGNGGEE